MRHLTLDQAAGALRRGKPVEQLLRSGSHDRRQTICWASSNPWGTHDYVVRIHHVYDEGSPAFRDLSEFTPVDVDEYLGEGVEVARHPHPEAALEAATTHGASNERWVNFGVIADEYADLRGWS